MVKDGYLFAHYDYDFIEEFDIGSEFIFLGDEQRSRIVEEQQSMMIKYRIDMREKVQED